MLRLAVVLILAATGTYFALQGPFYALLFYLGNAYFRPEAWVWGDFAQSLGLSFVIGLYLVISSVLSRHRFVWDGRIALLWSFLCLSFLSSVLSAYAADSWPYLVEFGKVVLVAYLIIVLTTDFAKFRLVILIMVLALGLEQSKQGWFYLLTSPGSVNNNPVAFLGDNNGTAIGMLMLVPLIGLLLQTTQNKLGKWFFSVLLVGSLYRSLSTYSRGGFLAAIAMGGAWLLRSRHKGRKFFGILVVLAIVLPALPDAFWNRMGTIQKYEEQQDKSALGRLHFWSIAVNMAAANPVLGVGFNSYNNAYDAYDSDGSYGTQRSVHNSFLGVLAELGCIGFFLYVLILWGAFRACAEVRRMDTGALDFGKSAIAIQTSLIAFVVGGFFIPLQYNEMLWHLIGLSMVLRRLAGQQKSQVFSAQAVVNRQTSFLRGLLVT